MPKKAEKLIKMSSMEHIDDRGNTLIVGPSGGTVFLAEVEPGIFLTVENMPDNYPSVTVSVQERTKEQAVAFVCEYYDGWEIAKNAIGVPGDTHVDGSDYA